MADQSLIKQGVPFIASLIGGATIFTIGVGLGMERLILSLFLVILGVGIIVFGLLRFFLSLGGKDS